MASLPQFHATYTYINPHHGSMSAIPLPFLPFGLQIVIPAFPFQNLCDLPMATFILRSDKTVHAFGWLCLLLMVHKGASYDFVVGSQKGWSVPNDPSFNPFNQWAEKSRFQIGDSLGEFSFNLCFLFTYIV